ncbi:hypothetical protein NXV12_02595 [Bacteroides thetaiotaomicron]|nr:hypothetical protein [Bacteroides thetaiotaomicron]
MNLWYRSPLRQEKEASFKVNTGINCWYDFGLGKGGNLLALAAELHPSSDISGLLRQIAERNPPVRPVSVSARKPPSEEPAFRHLATLPLTSHALLAYLSERGIGAETARRECREIRYECRANGIMPSAFRTLPAVLSFVAATSKVVYPQNQFR